MSHSLEQTIEYDEDNVTRTGVGMLAVDQRTSYFGQLQDESCQEVAVEHERQTPPTTEGGFS